MNIKELKLNIPVSEAKFAAIVEDHGTVMATFPVSYGDIDYMPTLIKIVGDHFSIQNVFCTDVEYHKHTDTWELQFESSDDDNTYYVGINTAVLYDDPKPETETRVYAIHPDVTEIEEHIPSLSDKDFMAEAESQGLVWGLKNFEEAFNNEQVSDVWFIRVVDVPSADPDPRMMMFANDDMYQAYNDDGVSGVIERMDLNCEDAEILISPYEGAKTEDIVRNAHWYGNVKELTADEWTAIEPHYTTFKKSL